MLFFISIYFRNSRTDSQRYDAYSLYHFNVNSFYLFIFFRDLDEALEMGMDWSLREGKV